MDLEDQTNEEYKKLSTDFTDTIKNLYGKSRSYINYKLGTLAGLFAGGIVYCINSDYGVWPASFAGGKQFLYNLFVGGFIA